MIKPDLIIEEEYSKRREFLGRQKARGREGFLLKRILENSFPESLGEEPIKRYPESVGWLYSNIDVVPDQISWDKLRSYMCSVDNVFLKCWNFEGSRGRIQPDPLQYCMLEQNALGLLTEIEYKNSKEIKPLLQKAILSPEEARNVLHHIRFKKSDIEGNLWGKKK